MNSTVIVTCRGNAHVLGKLVERDDLFATRLYTPLCRKGEHFAVVLDEGDFSLKLIRNSECFIINFLPFEYSKDEFEYNKYPGEHIDKFERLGIIKENSSRLDCPRMRDAERFYECRLVDEFKVGEKVLLIGRTLH